VAALSEFVSRPVEHALILESLPTLWGRAWVGGFFSRSPATTLVAHPSRHPHLAPPPSRGRKQRTERNPTKSGGCDWETAI
jgi:hypothetical protein